MAVSALVDHHPYLDGPFPRAYAHRGWHVDDLAGLENTLAAFHRAADEGFGYIELDVHASSDGVAFVHHDATLDRTTDGHGFIVDLTAAAIAEVRVRGKEPIPRLEQVLTELPEVRLTIELKSGAVVTPVLSVLERLDAWHRVCVGGFMERWLDRARAGGGAQLMTSMGQASAVGLRSRAWLDALPGPLRRLPVPPVRGRLAQLPRRLGPLTVVDEALLRAAHSTQREVHVWTVDDPGEMDELLDLGVDGLLSDRPDVLRDVLQRRDAWVS
ncbi:glycerophosphodiester phosphodiesterase family protein [Pseudonocardia sp.]|jgi:glycerophosphoryl diester phosphodiesterase|uniref:glycerophosphodiester phosphodiesterase family protein n=1 Tax=Pseudonocardia sp. TaxID=60912 RepID=UPI0026218ECA|nr:glycerophosphodiester phosphodiesterase family protein [Pseudonocardia sp.]MCW2721566.1 glycerophosphoryl diester phosphodiesterase [Pseudonocardia sp.]MDT7618339.1 glycerophosphoryl diester phosphodiesterase [Pseudonocardiales bacterium]